jgi:hypothetical protein
MKIIEENTICQLKVASTTTAAYVDLMLASQIIDSKPLYNEALNGLRSSLPRMNFTEASGIGFQAYFEVTNQDGLPSDQTAGASYYINDRILITVLCLVLLALAVLTQQGPNRIKCANNRGSW